MIDAGLVAHLKADANIAAYVGTRVYHQILPQNPTLPALVYSAVSEQRRMLLTTPDGLIGAQYSIDCFARTVADCKLLSEAVRLSLNGLTGSLGGVSIDHAQLQNRLDLTDFEGDKVTRRILLDFAIWYLE